MVHAYDVSTGEAEAESSRVKISLGFEKQQQTIKGKSSLIWAVGAPVAPTIREDMGWSLEPGDQPGRHRGRILKRK